MAETILIPVAEQILGKLASFAFDQLVLLCTLKPEILKLRDTVTSIQAVLLDAEEKQSHNHQVKLWLERLSDVMYDADDLLDDFSTEAALRRQAMARRRTGMVATCWHSVCSLVSSLPKQLMYDFKMARGIKSIRESLDIISKEKETFNLEVRTEEALSFRETDSCPPAIVVGREDDKKNIIHLLLNRNREANISVVPIVGMGGLGKTTLAQLVFDDDQVNTHFDIKAWVYVSQIFNVKVILGKMLRSINCQSEAGPELDDLQAQLREKIKGKRFLFVLDDVWEESSSNWESLGKYLTVGALGSKVLVTTRSTKVAQAGGGTLKSVTSTSIVEPYHLEGLSEEECWNLLIKKALPREVPRDPQVQEIGKQILRKCAGVPLAVSTIAGVLVDSSDPKTEWPSFLQKSPLSIVKEGEEDSTMSVLQLSFNHLPSHMKHCFTYCKLFRKGSVLPVQTLVQFWVAQGYIESEDRGIDCFKTLWWRSFFQEVEIDESGNMSTCRMHDLMHDLADSTAGEKIIRSSSSAVLKNIPSKTRHLFVLDNNNDDDDVREEDYGYDLQYASKVRTLMCPSSLLNKEREQVLNNFLRLRVLIILEEASNSDGEESSVSDASSLLNSIDKLKHLRYLALYTGRKKLPISVTNLVNLQVLILTNVGLLEELPRGTKVLVNLKHLELIGYEGVKLPDWLSDLKNLVELSLQDCKRCEYLPPQMHQLSSLKKLIIENCPMLKGIINNGGDHCDSSPDNSTTRLPTEGENDEWPRFRCLAHLRIRYCERLTRLPTFPTLEGKLVLKYTRFAPFARTMKMKLKRGGDGGAGYSGGTNIHPSSSAALVHPLSKLIKLTLSYINDDLESISHPNLNSCLVSLQKLKVYACGRCVKLPGSLCSSVYLTHIYIRYLGTVEYLPPLHELPSLSVLHIEECWELKGCWWKKKKGNDNDNHNGFDDVEYHNFELSMESEEEEKEDDEEWPHFPRLSTLDIVRCPKLTRMPLFPTVEGELSLRRTSAQALVRTMKMKAVVADSQQHSTPATTITTASSSSSALLLKSGLVTPLSKLTALLLEDTDDLESLPEEGLGNLTSLQEMVIRFCSRLASLPPAMRQLTSLQLLDIYDCEQLTERCKAEDWPNISHIPKIIVDYKTLQDSGVQRFEGNSSSFSLHVEEVQQQSRQSLQPSSP